MVAALEGAPFRTWMGEPQAWKGFLVWENAALRPHDFRPVAPLCYEEKTCLPTSSGPPAGNGGGWRLDSGFGEEEERIVGCSRCSTWQTTEQAGWNNKRTRGGCASDWAEADPALASANYGWGHWENQDNLTCDILHPISGANLSNAGSGVALMVAAAAFLLVM